MILHLSFAETIVLIVFSTLSVQGQHELAAYEVCDASGRVDSVTMIPCREEPCEFYKGTKTTVLLTGSFPGCKGNATKGRAVVELMDRKVPLPGVKADFCVDDADCDPSGDNVRTARITVPILTIYPNITAGATLTVGCGKGKVQACVKAVFVITEKPSDGPSPDSV